MLGFDHGQQLRLCQGADFVNTLPVGHQFLEHGLRHYLVGIQIFLWVLGGEHRAAGRRTVLQQCATQVKIEGSQLFGARKSDMGDGHQAVGISLGANHKQFRNFINHFNLLKLMQR